MDSSSVSITPGVEVRLWSMIEDTIVVSDTTDSYRFYADINYEDHIIIDSTRVRFYADYGTISDESFTIDGQASATYSPFENSSSFESKFITIKVSAAFTDSSFTSKLIYDSLQVFIKNEITGDDNLTVPTNYQVVVIDSSR